LQEGAEAASALQPSGGLEMQSHHVTKLNRLFLFPELDLFGEELRIAGIFRQKCNDRV
jgi:hypothetical protein